MSNMMSRNEGMWLSNGWVKALLSFNTKIKAFRTQFRGVGDVRFFMYRLATLYS